MLPAVQRIVTDIKALGYPVTRLHSDRGGEFCGNLVPEMGAVSRNVAYHDFGLGFGGKWCCRVGGEILETEGRSAP